MELRISDDERLLAALDEDAAPPDSMRELFARQAPWDR